MMEISRYTLLAIALIWLLVCALRGYYRGFLREIYTIAEIAAALFCLWAMVANVSIFSGGIPTFGGFLVILFVLRWIGRFLNIVNHIPVLGGVNRTLGVLIGIAKGLLLVGLVYSWLGAALLLESSVL